MSDPALVSRLSDINSSGAFNRWAEFEVVSASTGRVELRMRWREEAAQYSGFLHAGLIAALIDTACGFAAFSQAGPVLASHFSVSCVAPAIGVAFRAKAEIVKAGKRQVFTRAELLAEDKEGAQKLVAVGETILMPSPPA